jgi:hypothetical protein
LEDWSSKELIEFTHLMIAWLINNSQVDSCISTLQTNVIRSILNMPIWDLGDFTIYEVLVFAQRDFADDMLGDCLDDTWMIAVDVRYWSIEAFLFDIWRLGFMNYPLVGDHIDFSMIYELRVVIHWMGMIPDNGCDPLSHYKLWMRSEHDGQMTIIRVAQHQHGGSFMRITWDPGISIGDSVVVDIEVRASFFSHEVGSLVEQYIDELIELLKYRVALLFGGFQEASYVSTLPCHALSRGCFKYYKVIWDLGIIFSFSLDQSMERQVMMALLEDKKSLGSEDLPCPHFCVPMFCSRRDFCGLSVEKKRVKRGSFNVT